MPFRVGANRIKSNKVSSNTIGKAYIGNSLVYGAIPQPPSFPDSDVQALINAVYNNDGTLTSIEVTALNNLVSSLKTNNSGCVWNNAYAIYPFVGGTEASCAINLANPGTNDLSFDANWSFDSTGVTCIGGTASTGITTNPPTIQSYGIYVGTNVAETTKDIGGTNNGIITRSSPSEWARLDFDGSSTQTVSGLITDSRGWYYGYWVSGIQQQYFLKNGGSLTSRAISRNLTPYSLQIGNGSTKNYRFAVIGGSCTDYYSTIQTFQTTLGRAV